MSTFLATRKMDPALVLRIERSVGAGSRSMRGQRGRARLRTSFLRFAIALGLTVLATTALLARRRYQQEVNRQRGTLLATVQANGVAITPEERAFMGRVNPWLIALASSYEGDLVSDELRPVKALDAALMRASVYVRGPVSAFGNPGAIAEAASASTRDSFLLCLLDPPATRVEKVVLAKVRAAYAGGGNASEQARRLHEAEAGLRQILAPWEERIAGARELRDLDRVQAELAKVHVAETKRALDAELLIAAMDEADEPGPADLDGERAHMVRIGIVDLRAGRVLLRARKRVDPNWLAASTRANFASAVDGCALALDLRAGLAR